MTITIAFVAIAAFLLGARFGTQHATPRAFHAGINSRSPHAVGRHPRYTMARVEGGFF